MANKEYDEIFYEALSRYYGQNGYEENEEEAVKLFLKITQEYSLDEEEIGMIWYCLGTCYYDGRGGLEKNEEEAKRAFEKGAEADYDKATLALAEIYLFSDNPACLPLLERVAKKENVDAMAYLGNALLNNKFNTDSVGRGVDLLKRAIELGDGESAVQLGAAYREGEVVPQSDDLAAYYYDLAIEKGYTESWRAYYFSGIARFYGIGKVKQDWEKARAAFEKLPEFYQDNAFIRDYVLRANAILGSMCCEGAGGPVDIEAGFKYLRTAIESEPLEEDDKAFIQKAKDDLELYSKGELIGSMKTANGAPWQASTISAPPQEQIRKKKNGKIWLYIIAAWILLTIIVNIGR